MCLNLQSIHLWDDSHVELRRRFLLAAQCVLDLSAGRSHHRSGTGIYRPLELLKYSLAADPRDRVFALLGISKFDQRQHIIYPDYSKSVQCVCAEATVFALQESEECIYGRLPLQPLPGYGGQTLPYLPSWTSDLRICAQRPILFSDGMPWSFKNISAGSEESLLRELRHIPHRVTTSHAFKCLHTIGKHLGTICDVVSWIAEQLGRENAETIRNTYITCTRPRGIPVRKLLKAMSRDGESCDNAQELALMSKLFETFVDWPF